MQQEYKLWLQFCNMRNFHFFGNIFQLLFQFLKQFVKKNIDFPTKIMFLAQEVEKVFFSTFT